MKNLLLLALYFASNTLHAEELQTPSDIKNEIGASCKKGIPAVILFMTNEESSAQSAQDDNELYADWSYYLNEGIPEISERITVIKTPVASGRELFKSKQIPNDMFSLVFVPCAKKALYSESAIVEPYAYKFIKLYFENKEANLMMSELLEMDSKIIKDEAVTPKTMGLELIDVPM